MTKKKKSVKAKKPKAEKEERSLDEIMGALLKVPPKELVKPAKKKLK